MSSYEHIAFPQGVMSAADGLVRNEEVAGASPAALTISDGWQSSNAPVPKTERASGLRGCNPYTIRHSTTQRKESHETCLRLLSRLPVCSGCNSKTGVRQARRKKLKTYECESP